MYLFLINKMRGIEKEKNNKIKLKNIELKTV